ncbi:ribonuclease J [Halomonas heilongjiangensis]|uniref:MBL fold metallo-hydrolase n=1 Tax=Halomonas heilongjiangensis TaxID=1387883 RepID=A0A2N7TLJ2_9GAMM|nr:ribonuclease J [Halomonas heilongjiangensis]PMR69049.1 MBL fold metallo-hydrolase [Halomonas heilongjiangensis]PXX89068.1 MBL fold metallo-hydrolase [Halomonas heilongjiangensis]
MNLSLYGVESHWIAVDCGMMIRQDLPDSPLQVPNLDTLETLGITPRALIITHGHEDHIGAAAWLWPQWGCPIHATPLAAGLLRLKFAERGLATDAIRVIEPGEALECGPFTLRYLPLTHSIPESCALLVATGDHRVLHTGDWKLDPEPLIGAPVSASTFRAIAPVDLVVGDSTNAPLPGHSRSEGEVAVALEHAIARCEGRVVVSCFASNLARVLAIGRAAQRCGRRVSLMGRSMERMVRVARGLGYLDDFPPLVPVSDLGYLPAKEVLVIATGSQGEPRAALQRLARGRHPTFELGHGDSVIFSAKAIPGNELLIQRLKAGLEHLGVALLDEFNHPELHASGHPAQDELRTFYGWVKPGHLLPVHGEPRHQQAHQALAETLGIRAPLIPTNGDLIRLDGDGLTLEARHPQPPCIVSQNAVAPLPGLGAEGGPRSRHGSLYLALSVTATEARGWTRIGRLMLDASDTGRLDEDAFTDWLDMQLLELRAETLAELRLALQPKLLAWFADHLRRIPAIHLQILAVEAPSLSDLD